MTTPDNTWSPFEAAKGHNLAIWRYIESHPGIISHELREAFAYVAQRTLQNTLKRMIDKKRIKRVRIDRWSYSYTALPTLLPYETPPVFKAYENLQRMQNHARSCGQTAIQQSALDSFNRSCSVGEHR